MVEPEVVAAQDADVGVHERRYVGQILVPDLLASLAQVRDRLVEVERIPEGDGVQDEPQRGGLVLLALAVALPDPAAVAVEELAQGCVASRGG